MVLIDSEKSYVLSYNKRFEETITEETYPHILNARYDKTITDNILNRARQRFCSKIRNEVKVLTLSILIQ